MVAESRKSFCRMCQAFCGYDVRIEDGRITRLRGDRSDPQSEGYACFKGLKHLDLYASDIRLLHSRRRTDGGFVPGSSEQLLDEAGARLADIVAAHGPEAVGFFIGTQALFNTTAPPMIGGFAAALGTPRVFTTMTIDQSAKWIGEFRLGRWAAGPQPFDSAEAWMFVGSNPVNTMVAGGGCNQFAFSNGHFRLKRARERGMKIVVIDPRRTETAAFADLHLPLRPGTDVFMAAALLHTIISEGWHDADFCQAYVDGLDALAAAVAPYAPEAVEAIVDVPAALIREAARLFAHEARSGMVGTGTGPDMARNSNVAEHLYQAINVVCGRFPRAGEEQAGAFVLRAPVPPSADVILPPREWESGPKTLRHGLGRIKNTMMSAELAHEILHPDPRRMRALICVGGNPAVALPNQALAERALGALDLLIVIDPVMSATARLADYVFAPRLHFERADSTQYLEGMFQRPFAHVTDALVDPPAGSDVVDDWYVLLRLAAKLGLTLPFAGAQLSGPDGVTTVQLLRLLAAQSAIPFDAMLAHEGAVAPDVPPQRVQPRQHETRFALLPPDVAAEFARAVAVDRPQAGTFQLTVRRNKDLMNSTGAQLAATVRKHGANTAFLHPDDLAAFGLAAGELIRIATQVGSVTCPVAPDPSLRPGIVSVGHGWSGNPARAHEATNALVDDAAGIEPLNAMPVMTGMAVTITRAAGASAPA